MLFHVVRRSNHCWARLSSVLVNATIDEVSREHRLSKLRQWVQQRNAKLLEAYLHLVTSEYNSAMQDFTELAYTTSPQHKDSTGVRIKRDASDLKKLQTKITSVLTLDS
ncbi:hypothetical protein DPMN_113912 [Dreissena polymorpha]|uniref:Uncharacterized protein n=1 Tax=Dreissena polymorpha TaxID=45954 RepID=A0A9D4QRG8_DREPO|nr:hypothetical protein DPMN_113912 [Dreissena polymorpha]